MSEMSSTVVVRLQDDLTSHARRAAEAVKVLVRDIEKLKALSGKMGGSTRQIESMTRNFREAKKAVQGLRGTIEKSVPNGFARATAGIDNVRKEAIRATRAVGELEARLRKGGSFRGSVGAGGGGHGGGGRGWFGVGRGGGGGHGVFGHSSGHLVRHALGTAGGLAMYSVGAHVAAGIAESFKAGISQSFEKNHTIAMLRMQGESVGDINAAVAQANVMTRSLPQFTSAQHLEAIAELRPALVGGLQEATKLAPMFQNVVGVLEAAKQGNGRKAMGGVDTHGEALELVRALEVKGVTQKGEGEMKSYADNITKAIVAFNGQIGAKDFHAAFKFSKFAATGWSEDFSTQILPTLINEMKASMHASASSTGVALKSMYQAVVSNKMTGPALDAWFKLGMYDKSDLDFKKDGHVKGAKTGMHMKGFETFMADPYKFVQDVLLPTMKASGLDIGNAKLVQAKMGELFGNRNAEFIGSLLALQKKLIEKDRENVLKAMGMDGIKFLINADSTVRMQVFAAAFKELGGAIGDLALPGNMRGLKGLIDWAHGMSDAVKGSAYAKKLGGYWESAIAGIFGQRLGRKGMAARNGEYYGAGRALGSGASHLQASFGQLGRTLEEIGFFSGSLRAAAAGLNGLASAVDAVRSVIAELAKASPVVQKIIGDIAGVTAALSVLKGAKFLTGGFGLSGAAVALKGAAEALTAAAGAQKVGAAESAAAAGAGLLGKGKFLPPIPLALGYAIGRQMVDGLLPHPSYPKGYDGDKKVNEAMPESGPLGLLRDLWHDTASARKWMGESIIGSAHGEDSRRARSPFGALPSRSLFGDPKASASGAVQPIIDAVKAAAPLFAQAAQADMVALDGGLSAGSAAATGRMHALMANLAAIAAAGVTVPVKLDTAAAEAKLQNLMAKAGSLGSGRGSAPQFSKALNDIGA